MFSLLNATYDDGIAVQEYNTLFLSMTIGNVAVAGIDVVVAVVEVEVEAAPPILLCLLDLLIDLLLNLTHLYFIFDTPCLFWVRLFIFPYFLIERLIIKYYIKIICQKDVIKIYFLELNHFHQAFLPHALDN